MQDTSRIKERILQVLRMHGPNFPSPIASEIQTSILFTSAFLSELLADKKIKITNMKVGSSPIYYIPGQENQLENFATKYLKSKEKDAFIILNEKRVLKDKEQDPAIRVALRQIKDFAFPIEKDSELYWRYFLTPEEEINNSENKKNSKEIKEEKPREIFDKETEKIETEKTKELSSIVKKKPKKKSVVKKSPAKKQDDKFFNIVKEYLSKNNIEISDIIGFNKTDLFLKVKNPGNQKEYLLVAYNKKRIAEKEFIDAYKKASELNLDYTILSPGEPTKKLAGFIDAIKKIKSIEKID